MSAAVVVVDAVVVAGVVAVVVDGVVVDDTMVVVAVVYIGATAVDVEFPLVAVVAALMFDNAFVGADLSVQQITVYNAL